MRGMATLRCWSQRTVGELIWLTSGPGTESHEREVRCVLGSQAKEAQFIMPDELSFSFLSSIRAFAALGLWCMLGLVGNDLPLQMARTSFQYILIPLYYSEASRDPLLSRFKNTHWSCGPRII